MLSWAAATLLTGWVIMVFLFIRYVWFLGISSLAGGGLFVLFLFMGSLPLLTGYKFENLLHGFYQHHHLLLIRRQSDTDVSYYIGVPGIYNEKEQMLASMFGFEEFRMMKGAGTRGEEMGYWCRVLQ